jgi:bisphosphoglycerate-independent phosphoglycerate mutase (AlkP superfamily)
MTNRKPRVLYIAYGETDEWAHAGQYRSYLDAAKQTDAWIKQIWEYIQSDPFYKNKTTLLITTDHGRGDLVKDEWTSHNNKVAGSDEIWFAAIGSQIPAIGELRTGVQLYQKQFAATIGKLVGYNFNPGHPVAEPIPYIFKPAK